MAAFIRSSTPYVSGWEKRATQPVFIVPGLEIETGSGRLGVVGLTRNREGELCLVTSDSSAPTSWGRRGCHAKWIEMEAVRQ